MLKRYLSEGLGLPDIPNSPRLIFRLAHEHDLFDSPLSRWRQYAEARIGTSHDYDGEKAKTCLALMPDFIDDAIELDRKMSGAAWD